MAKKWLFRLLALTLSLVALMCAAAYWVDPYMQYRVRDNRYLLNSRLVTPGLIKNDDYDTVLIGSSMIQNTDMALFRETLGGKPLKITTGAISLKEIQKLTDKINQVGKAQNYYICLDQYLFAPEKWDDMDRFPDYLMDDDLFNDYRYLLGYETWTRFMPIDLGLSAARALNISLPDKFTRAMSIDGMEDWREDWAFGSEAVLSLYAPPPKDKDYDLDRLLGRMETRFDEYLTHLDFETGAYTFFFPPYSALFWNYAEGAGYGDLYLAFKTYAEERLLGMPNVKIFDFQNADFITDLEQYKDYTHYAPSVNDWMLRCFASGDYQITEPTSVSNLVKETQAQVQQLLVAYPQIPH